MNIFINKNYKNPRSRILGKEILSKYYASEKNILEIGPREQSMKEYFPDIITLDIDPEMKPDIVDDAEDMHNIKDSSFDVIYSCHFLEHVYRPEKVLKACNRILKQNGMMFFIIPVVALDKLWKDGDPWSTHQHHFTKQNIVNLLDGSGFRLINLHYRLWVKPVFLEKPLGNILKKGDIFFIAQKI